LYCDGQVELSLIPPATAESIGGTITFSNVYSIKSHWARLSQGGHACKSGERQQPATILEFLLNAEALRGSIVSSDTIYPALSNKARSAATERNLGDFQLTFLLIEARH